MVVLPEEVEGEVEPFTAYWPRDLFIDDGLVFFKALGGGKIVAAGGTGRQLWELLKPWGKVARVNGPRYKAFNEAEEAAGRTPVEGNLNGGAYMKKGGKGGLLLLDAAGEVRYTFVEEAFGDHAEVEEVLAQCRALVGSTVRAG